MCYFCAEKLAPDRGSLIVSQQANAQMLETARDTNAELHLMGKKVSWLEARLASCGIKYKKGIQPAQTKFLQPGGQGRGVAFRQPSREVSFRQLDSFKSAPKVEGRQQTGSLDWGDPNKHLGVN